MMGCSFLLLACQNQAEEVILPDILDMHIIEAKLTINGEFLVNEVYIHTNKYIPNTVISYGNDMMPGDKFNKNKRIDIHVSKAPIGSFTLSDEIEYVYEVADVTGPLSPNHDILINSGIGGTDLGIPVLRGNQMLLLYGDSFSNVGSHGGFWFSNFIATNTDFDLSDGLIIDSVITTPNGIALPFRQGDHFQNISDELSNNPNREVTKIPTGGITIGDITYIFYMSIRYWGVPGEWLVTYNQAVKSSGDLTSWTDVDSLIWRQSEAPNFGQINPFENPDDPDRIYFMGIPGGRSGSAVLFRVDKDDFEDRDAYEYLVGQNNWVQGDEGLQMLLANPHPVILGPVSELSLMFNEYLGQWMAVYLKGSQIIMQLADDLTGPWGKSIPLTSQMQHPGLYGGFVHSAYTAFMGRKFYIQVSLWLPKYQTVLLEVLLK